MKDSRYPNGYTPKIEYYQAKLGLAVDSLNIESIKFYTDKLEYFMTREARRLVLKSKQRKLYGKG